MNPIALTLLIALATALLAPSRSSGGAQAAFLPKLALRPAVTTPSDLLLNGTDAKVKLDGRMAFTAVFTRPVIALGSDFGIEALPPSMIPFHLTCGIPGRFRWVTTSIFRWDPLMDWPPDMDCEFKWNRDLKAFDGAPLVLWSPPTIRVVSVPSAQSYSGGGATDLETTWSLDMSGAATVVSAMADAATGGLWSAFQGLSDDEFPELPPDGEFDLTFTYPVVPALVQPAFVVEPCCNPKKTKAAPRRVVKVRPCQDDWRDRDLYDPSNPDAPPLPADPMQRLTTCLMARLVPGLKRGETASVYLPKGAMYNPVAGRLHNNTTKIYLHGLRRFRVPLVSGLWQPTVEAEAERSVLEEPSQGYWYRRATMWLPHGLAAGVSTDDLARQIEFCRYGDPYDWETPCVREKFTLERLGKGKVAMRMPGLMPRQHYALRIKNSTKVRDAFGLPLEATEVYFFTADIPTAFGAPQTPGGSRLMVLEPAPGGAPLIWPLLARGNSSNRCRSYDRDSCTYPIQGAAAWPLTPDNYLTFLGVENNNGFAGSVANTKLGRPRAAVKRSQDVLPHLLRLEASGAPGTQAILQFNNTEFRGTTLVSQTYLHFASTTVDGTLMVWVTDVRGSPPPPVEGAAVTLYSAHYESYPVKGTPHWQYRQGPSCRTGKDGTCAINMRAWGPFYSLGSVSALVDAPKQGLLLIPSINLEGAAVGDTRSGWAATLVFDRRLVQAGDTLHMTGYVQMSQGTHLVSPAGHSLTAQLTIGGGFNASDYQDLKFPVKIDPAYGSFQASVAVPQDAPLRSYRVDLEVREEGGDNGGGYRVSASDEFQVADPRPPTAAMALTAPDWVPPNMTARLQLKVASYLGADVSDARVKISWSTKGSSGAFNVTTNGQGLADVIIPLDRVNGTEDGYSVSVTADWVGPTGEPLTKSVSFRVAEGAVRASLAWSPATNLPGVPFIVAATTTLSDAADTPVQGVAVDVSLTPRNDNLTGCSAAARAELKRQRCRLVSGAPPMAKGGAPACTLTIPCEADFWLEACAISFSNGTAVKGFAGKPPCRRETIGGRDQKWSSHDNLVLLPDRVNYTVGSTAAIAFATPPYSGEASGILFWGNRLKRLNRTLARLPPGPIRVEIALGEEDARASLALPEPGRGRLDVTVSAAGPEGLRTRDGGLPIVPPLGAGSVKVAVKDATTGAPAAGAQITVFAVDKAILDLMPYPLKDVTGILQPESLDFSFPIFGINDLRVTREAINATFAAMERRLAVDPWLEVVTSVDPSWADSYVSEKDSDYINRYGTSLTVWPGYSWGPSQRYPEASKGPGGVKGAKLRIGDLFKAVPLCDTAFAGADGVATFELPAPANLGTFVIRAYAVSKAAAAGGGDGNGEGGAPAANSYGSGETQAVVRLPVSLTPALPRMVRVSDVFESGVIVTAPDAGNSPMTVTIKATVTPPSALKKDLAATSEKAELEARTRRNVLRPAVELAPQSPFFREVQLSASRQQQTVRFRFTGAAVGESGLRFDAYLGPAGAAARAGDAGAAAVDSASYDVPVLGRQRYVSLATSFVLQGESTGDGQADGLALPAADPGTGSIDVLAGVGNLPFIKATYASLLESHRTDLDPGNTNSAYARPLLSLAVLPALMGRYQAAGPENNGGDASGANGNATSWISPEDLAVSRAAAELLAGGMTDQQWGLKRYAKDSNSECPRAGTDVDLNIWALWLLQEAEKMKPAPGDVAAQAVAAYLKPLREAADASWRPAADREIWRSAWRARYLGSGRGGDDLEALSWVRLVLGADWEPPHEDQDWEDCEWQYARPRARAWVLVPRNASTWQLNTIADDLYFSRLVKAYEWEDGLDTMDLGAAARTALAILAHPDVKATTSAAAMGLPVALAQLMQSQARVQGRTAYIAQSRDWAHTNDPDCQAFALVLLSAVSPHSGPEGDAVQKIAAGLAKGPRQVGFGPLVATYPDDTATNVAVALATYDDSRGSTRPNVTLDVTVGPAPPPENAGNGSSIAAAGGGDSLSLLRAEFTPRNAGGAVSAATPWADLPLNATRLTAVAAGRGEVSVAAGLTFVPATLLPFPTYRGIWVERVIQTESGQANLAAIGQNQIVTVSIQVTTPDDLDDVTLDVLMPGGLEALDPAVYPDQSSKLDFGNSGGGCGYWCGWWSGPTTEYKPSTVVARYSTLRAGTSTLAFKAVAATPGVFVLPPVKASVKAQPEVMGLSPAGHFVVCPSAPPPMAAAAAPSAAVAWRAGGGASRALRFLSAAALKAAAADGSGGDDPSWFGPLPPECASAAASRKPPVGPAKACPKDCSGGGGVCDIASGRCLCAQGLTGDDCSKPAPA